MDIIDEIPDLNTLPEKHVSIHAVVMKSRPSRHLTTRFYVVCFTFNKEDFNKKEFIEELGEDLKVLGLFLDKEKSEKFLYYCTHRATCRYTSFLNTLPDLSEVNERSFIVYLDDNVTREPGLYEVKKTDYIKLKGVYPTVRLATPEELKNVPEYFSCFIPTDYETVKKLDLIHLKALLITPPSSDKDYGYFTKECNIRLKHCTMLKTNCMQLAGKNPLSRKEDAIENAMRIIPNRERAEAMVDNMIQSYADLLAGKTSYDYKLVMTIKSRETHNVIHNIEY